MDIWKHRKYVDMWSIVHFLSGFLLVTVFNWLDYTFTSALLISTILLLAWEAFEWVIKIIEPSINVVMDMVLGLSGFFVGVYLYYFLNKPFDATYFWTILIIVMLLSSWGFFDFLKRGYR